MWHCPSGGQDQAPPTRTQATVPSVRKPAQDTDPSPLLHNIIEIDLLNAQLLPILMTLIFPLCLPSRKLLYKKYTADSLKNENLFH